MLRYVLALALMAPASAHAQSGANATAPIGLGLAASAMSNTLSPNLAASPQAVARAALAAPLDASGIGNLAALAGLGVAPRRVCIVNAGTIINGDVRGRVNNRTDVRNIRITCGR